MNSRHDIGERIRHLRLEDEEKIEDGILRIVINTEEINS